MTNWRALCEDLVLGCDVDGCDWKPQHQARWNAAIERARALLAQPEPEVVGPSVEELDDLFNEIDQSGEPLSWRAYARAVLSRWGRPAPAPAGEVAKLVQPPGRAGLTWQGVIEGLRDVLNDESEDAIQRVWQRSRILDAISVMEANPCPAPTPAGEVVELVAWLRAWARGTLEEGQPATSRSLLDGYAAEIRALRDWLVPEEPPPHRGMRPGGTNLTYQETLSVERQRLRDLLTAEADRAERGEL